MEIFAGPAIRKKAGPKIKEVMHKNPITALKELLPRNY
jgi:hypothetical protein